MNATFHFLVNPWLSVLVASANHSCMKVELLPMFFTIIKSNLFPYLNQHFNSTDEYVFWPNLATCQYHKDVQKLLSEMKIQYVKKEDNPSYAPSVLPIELFWAHLKAKVYYNDWKCESKQALMRSIRFKIRTFDFDYCQRLFSGLKIKIRIAADNGLQSVQGC